MREYISLEEAIALIADGDILQPRWRDPRAQDFFIRTINTREMVFPIEGKLRYVNKIKTLDGFFRFTQPKLITEQAASAAFGLKEYGYNAADDFINISEIRDQNRRPIKKIDCFFPDGKGSGLIVPFSSLCNPSLIFGHGGFLCYADIRIPAADFEKVVPLVDTLSKILTIAEIGEIEEMPHLCGDSDAKPCILPVKTINSQVNSGQSLVNQVKKAGIDQKIKTINSQELNQNEIKNNQKNQNDVLIDFEKTTKTTETTQNNPEAKTAVFREMGRKGGKAKKTQKLLKKYVEDFAKNNQSTTFEKAWKKWKNDTPATFEDAEFNFTETKVEIDGKTLKKDTVKRYFYDAKKVLQ